MDVYFIPSLLWGSETTRGHVVATQAAASISISHEMNLYDSEVGPQDGAVLPRTIQTQRVLYLAWQEPTALLVRNADGKWVRITTTTFAGVGWHNMEPPQSRVKA